MSNIIRWRPSGGGDARTWLDVINHVNNFRYVHQTPVIIQLYTFEYNYVIPSGNWNLSGVAFSNSSEEETQVILHVMDGCFIHNLDMINKIIINGPKFKSEPVIGNRHQRRLNKSRKNKYNNLYAPFFRSCSKSCSS